MSVAVVALIGFALDYTQLGVRLNPVISFVAAFIFLTSVISLIRQTALPGGITWWHELDTNQPALQIPAEGRSGYVVSTLIVLAAVAVSGYLAFHFKANEKFTEFYVLGPDGKAQNYPSSFAMQSGKVTSVNYTNGVAAASQWGEVLLNVVNHESSTAAYSIKVCVDGQPVDLMYGNTTYQYYDIRLNTNDRWNGEVGFSPAHSGQNQKVDFLLFKDGQQDPETSLSLWVNAEDRMP